MNSKEVTFMNQAEKHTKKKKNESNTRTGCKSLDNLAQKIIRPLLKKHGAATATLSLDWPLIVGEYLSSITRPHKLYFSKGEKRKGRLQLKIINAYAHEFPFYRQTMIEKINAYFGYNSINDITILQSHDLEKLINNSILEEKKEHINLQNFHAEKKKIEKNLTDIKNEKLRLALAEMGAHIRLSSL